MDWRRTTKICFLKNELLIAIALSTQKKYNDRSIGRRIEAILRRKSRWLHKICSPTQKYEEKYVDVHINNIVDEYRNNVVLQELTNKSPLNDSVISFRYGQYHSP